jgi:hypothetical protein
MGGINNENLHEFVMLYVEQSKVILKCNQESFLMLDRLNECGIQARITTP